MNNVLLLKSATPMKNGIDQLLVQKINKNPRTGGGFLFDLYNKN
jgi:hypothetical protein